MISIISEIYYFFFSNEHTGNFGKVTRVGIYFLMISFGASFGFAVTGRISLLIGRFVDLIDYSGAQYHYASLWVLVIMVALLRYSAFTDKGKPETEMENIQDYPAFKELIAEMRKVQGLD